MRRKLVEEEITEESQIFRDFLFDIVPINRIAETFEHACKKQTSSFAPNYFDIKNAWLEIEAKERAEKEKQVARENLTNPVASCMYKNLHINAAGEAKIFSESSQSEEIAPCYFCRNDDYKKWFKSHNALYGNHQPKTVLPAQNPRELEPARNLLLFKLEEKITEPEAAALALKHNELVRKLETDENVQKRLFIIWDEGARCFARDQFRSQTFSVDAVRRVVEGYQKVLEEKGNDANN